LEAFEERIASIDVGANSIRLLVANIKDGGMERLFLDRKIVRLGKGISDGDMMLADRMELALEVLEGFRKVCDSMGARRVVAVGTSPLRKARNAHDFVERVRKRTGIEIRTLGGEEEGYICLLGILKGMGMGLSSRAVMIDVEGEALKSYFGLVKKGSIPSRASLSG